jgi:hypothetical protein
MSKLTTAPIYAAHRDGTRWSILAPCEDPLEPSWRVVDVLEEPGGSEVAASAELRRIRQERRDG